ncbi:hypothetical protein H9Q69_002974 [Fusarium xylarioides]|nr:hypothetical protein H9Q69_002974 [Fusarium xylarioides]
MENSKPLLLAINGISGHSTHGSLPEEAPFQAFDYEPCRLIEPKGVRQLAQESLEFFLDHIEGDQQRPIICLAFDLGGLILKEIVKPKLAQLGCAFEETIFVNADYEDLTRFRGKVHRDKYLQILSEAMAVAAPQYRSLIATLELFGSHSIYVAPQKILFGEVARALITQVAIQEWLSSDARKPMALQVPLSFQNDDFVLSIATYFSELRHEGFRKFLVLTIILAQPACKFHGNLAVSLLSDLIHQAYKKQPLLWKDISSILSHDDLISVFSGLSRSLLEPVLWRCLMALLATNKPIACVMSLAGTEQDNVSWKPVLQRLVSVAASVDCDFKLMVLYNSESPVDYLRPVMNSKLDVNDSSLRESIFLDMIRTNAASGEPELEELRRNISAAVSDVHGESLRLTSFIRYIGVPGPFPQQQLRNGWNLICKEVQVLPEIFRNVPDSSKEHVRDILFLVAYSSRPLTLSELADAMKVMGSSEVVTSPPFQRHFASEIQQCLAASLPALLRADHGVVRLIHPDVKHLLDESQSTPVFWYLPDNQSQLNMAKLCIQCIESCLVPEDTEEQLESDSMITDDEERNIVSHPSARRPFLDYAILNWPFHLIQALLSECDEASTREVVALMSDKLLTQWLNLQTVLRHPAKHFCSVPSLKLSPLKLAERYGLVLHCALKVCLQALDSFVALDGKEDVAILWSITKIVGVEAGAKAWKTSVQQNLGDSAQVFECFGLDPSIAFDLQLAIDEDYLRSHLPAFISREIYVGGHRVLEYVLKQSPVSRGSLFQSDNWCPGSSPLQALREEASRGLLFTDDGTRVALVPLASIGMAQTLLEAGDSLKDVLDCADSMFTLIALHAIVGGGHGSIAGVMVRLKPGLGDDAVLNALAVAADSGFAEVLDELLPHSNPEHLNHLIGGARTLLHFAIRKGFIRMASTLLDHGAVIDVNDCNGTTPFLEAVEFGKLPIVHRLSRQARESQGGVHGEDEEMADSSTAIDKPNEEGLAPVISSLKDGFHSISEIILEGAVKLDITDSDGNNPAHLAAEAGYSKLLERILKRNEMLFGESNEEGYTPLQLAVRHGHAECVSFLMENGASGDLTSLIREAIEGNDQGVFQALLPHGKGYETLGESLHYAALNGRPEMCSMLLDAGADKNYQDSSGNTALGLAAYSGHSNVTEILLLRRVKLEDKDSWGRTALCDAVRNGFQGVCKLLLDAGADVLAEDMEGETPLDLVTPGNQDLFSLLWKSWVSTLDPDERITQMTERLGHAINNGYSKIVSQALSEGVKPTSKHLSIAIKKRHANIVSLLIARGADLNDVKIDSLDIPIHYAAFHCDLDLADVLLTKGKADVNQTGGSRWSALHACLKSWEDYENKKAMLAMLIQNRANVVDTSGPSGSVLQVALKSAPKLAEYLIENCHDSIKLSKGDVEGRLPAHFAAERNNVSVLSKVLDHSSTTPDCQQRLPTHFAAAGGSLNALQYIMKYSIHGADLLLATDNDGWNVLHWACRQEDSFLVEWILSQAGERGSSLSLSKAKEPQGWQPLDVAIKHGNEHMLDRLVDVMWEAERLAQGKTKTVVQRPLARWELSTAFCDSCLCSIYGKRHKCLECPDYDLCFKCIRHVEAFHKEHEFDVIFRIQDS